MIYGAIEKGHSSPIGGENKVQSGAIYSSCEKAANIDSVFINRNQEIKAFEIALERVGEEQSAPRVLCFTGLIGVGKTHLLTHLRRVAQEKGVICAFANLSEREPIELLLQWLDDLEELGIDLKEFKSLLQQHKKSGPYVKDTSSTKVPVIHRPELLQILTSRFNEDELRSLCFELNLDYDNLRNGNKKNKARELILYFERRKSLPKLVRAVKRMRPDISECEISGTVNDSKTDQEGMILAERFVNDLVKESSNNTIVFFLDGFENPSFSSDQWLRDLVTRVRSHKILWVIASWGGLSGDWEHQIVRSYHLLPFSSAAVGERLFERDEKDLGGFLIQFLEQSSVPRQALTAKNISWVQRETLGLPYMLNVASRRLRGEKISETPSESLVRRIKEWINDKSVYKKVRRCAVARRRLDRDIARALLDDGNDVAEFWGWLISTPLVERAFSQDMEEQIRFNAILRTAILRAIYSYSEEEYNSLHKRLLDFYSTQIQNRFSNLSLRDVCLRADNPREWAFHLEKYYHALSRSPRSIRWLGIELVVLLLDINYPQIFRRIYDIVQAFDNVIMERSEARWALGKWRKQFERIAHIIELSDSYTAIGFEKAEAEELKAFFEQVKDEEEIQMNVRTIAAEWFVNLEESTLAYR